MATYCYCFEENQEITLSSIFRWSSMDVSTSKDQWNVRGTLTMKYLWNSLEMSLSAWKTCFCLNRYEQNKRTTDKYERTSKMIYMHTRSHSNQQSSGIVTVNPEFLLVNKNFVPIFKPWLLLRYQGKIKFVYYILAAFTCMQCFVKKIQFTTTIATFNEVLNWYTYSVF
jgi:hypothetical protein